MKRYVVPIFVSAVLLLMCASASLAVFPGTQYGTNVFPPLPYGEPTGIGFNNRVGDGLVWVALERGWVLGAQAWYACFATNNLRMAQTKTYTLAPYPYGVKVDMRQPILLPPTPQSLTLTPKLTSALGNGAQPMYIVTNYNNNGVVFSTSPLTVNPYTGLWEVVYITWLPGVTPWIITDTSAPAGSAPGLPIDGVQATFSSFPVGMPPNPLAVPTVLDCPIFAVGVISNPWFKPSQCPPDPIYRIPQGIQWDYQRRWLLIPYWYVYCQNEISRAISVKKVIIPDASDPGLAALIGANYAPLLANVPIADRSNLFVFNWAQDLNPDPEVYQPLKVLANQYPLLQDCPTTCAPPRYAVVPANNLNSNGNSLAFDYCAPDCGWRNANYDYSPVDSFILLNRDLNLISPEVPFNNVPFLLQQIARGAIVPVQPYGYPPEPFATAVNAPVICIPYCNATVTGR